jgi:hypothetical protein
MRVGIARILKPCHAHRLAKCYSTSERPRRSRVLNAGDAPMLRRTEPPSVLVMSAPRQMLVEAFSDVST